MSKWEYYVATMFNDSSVGTFEAELDEIGKEGWELVSVVGRASECTQFHAFFKRPLRQGEKTGESNNDGTTVGMVSVGDSQAGVCDECDASQCCCAGSVRDVRQ